MGRDVQDDLAANGKESVVQERGEARQFGGEANDPRVRTGGTFRAGGVWKRHVPQKCSIPIPIPLCNAEGYTNELMSFTRISYPGEELLNLP